MIRPLAVLLALAVTVLGLVVAWSPGSPGPPLQQISAPLRGAPLPVPAGGRADDRVDERVLDQVARAERAADAVRRPAAADRSGSRLAAPAVEGDEFSVTLDAMSPVIPRRGPLTLDGTVTNTSDETWTALNIHPLTSYYPMTTARELEVSAESDPEIYLGQRITTAGAFDGSIESLAPGESARWSIRIPRGVLQISGDAGVYWVGVQVLGADSDGTRDGLAHGRARSFVPLVGADPEAVPTSVVLPVRRPVARTPEGRLSDVDEWTEDLTDGGRLDNLLQFVRASRSTPVTWLLDPAVLDAVQQLSEGNRELSLDPVPTGNEASDEEDDPQADEETDGEAAEEPEVDPEAISARAPATAWLEGMGRLTGRNPVLGLPYGDVDVAAAAEDAPGLYARAQSLATSTFAGLGITASPAVVPPPGVLSGTALDMIGGDTDVLLSEEALPARFAETEEVPDTIEVGGNRVGIHDSAASTGGPGPDRRLAPVALRQRLLAEAAVRSVSGSDDRLQVVLPPGFDPGPDGAEFFAGLEQPFLRMEAGGTSAFDRAEPVEEVTYPDRMVNRELTATQMTSATELVEVGETLDSILPGTDEVSAGLLAQALCSASYSVRDDPVGAAEDTRNTIDWARAQLERIRVEAPSFVILSSERGPFAVTVTNGLDQAVEVRIEAYTPDDLVIMAPETISLEGRTQQTVQLDAEARSIGVHSVRLVTTSADGTPLGSVDAVSVRSNEVGRVIWVILGAGVVMLFLAIPVRWYRRWRRSRAA